MGNRWAMVNSSHAAPHAAVFFDRDGTLNVDLEYVYRPGDLRWQPGAIAAVKLVNALGRKAIVITNQSGVARGMFAEADVHRFHARMSEDLAAEGAHIDAWYACYHLKDAKLPEYAHPDHPDRKPNPGMVLRAIVDHGLDPDACLMVGDKPRDIEAGRRAGVRGVLYGGGRLDVCVAQALGLRD
jgi:D-glycero-D-manno-heptose 1,7-bisphosphate phosphatase